MVVNLDINVSDLDPQIFMIPVTKKDEDAYKEAFSQWEKLPEPRPASPEMPRFSLINPALMASNMIKNTINSTNQVGKTGHLRHILRLNNDINEQISVSKELNLPTDDLNYIRKVFSQHDWPLKDKDGHILPQDFSKFIILVEDALKNAKNK
jgi:hypothetical protein